MCDSSWKHGARSAIGELNSPTSSGVIHASANGISAKGELSGKSGYAMSKGGDWKMLLSTDADIHSGKEGIARYASE